MPIFHAIAAMSENRVIGNQGKIPWHIPEDFRWFKHKTMGGTLIMGRKTFESIGKPLPGRKTVVLTHRPLAISGVDSCSNLALFDTEYLKKHQGEDFWVCGGGTIYSQLLDHCSHLYLTIVKKQIAGDVFFPEHFLRTHALEQLIYDNPDFRVERWKYRKLPPEFELVPETWPFST
jgi:dihydrofolate reductase